MPALLITSPASQSGKTALAAGLAARLQAAGRSVGYARTAAESMDRDVAALRTTIGADSALAATNLAASLNNLAGRQVLLVETDGATAAATAEQADARAVLVLRGTDSDLPQQIAAARASLGERLGAVVVNGVPAARVAHVRELTQAAATSHGLGLAGVIPQSRALIGVSVRDLARALQPASVVGDPDRDAVVERLLVGTMGLDNALQYFGRFRDKAAIISVNRPDLMIAALQTHTLCIVAASENPIITGTSPVNPVVVARARERDVPILVTGRPTLETVEQVERIFGATAFGGAGKVQVARALVDEHVDLDVLGSLLA